MARGSELLTPWIMLERRHAIPPFVVSMLMGCTPAGGGLGPVKETGSMISGGQMASLGGTAGTITTLAFYPGGAPHPGVNAVDVGAGGGSAVWHQIDYVPANVSGGWVYVSELHESGYCSQWSPGSPYYNGAKISVDVYFYDDQGNYAGWHRAAFQHVVPHAPNMNAWFTWNNAAGSARAWPAGAAISYGNQVNDGLYLGQVFAVARPIYNGPSGGLCTDGSHLHQEGEGIRAGQLTIGRAVQPRYSDLHYFTPRSGWAPSGQPPSPPAIGTPTDPCQGYDYLGQCSGTVLTWCENGVLRVVDCADTGRICAWQDDTVGNNCM